MFLWPNPILNKNRESKKLNAPGGRDNHIYKTYEIS